MIQDQLSRGHLLVVDDEEAWRQAFRRNLTEAGYLVTTCGEQEDKRRAVLRLLRREPFDLLIVDLRLHSAIDAADFSGLKLAAVVRLQFPDLPIVLKTVYAPALSGILSDDAAARGLDAADAIVSGNGDLFRKLLSTVETLAQGRPVHHRSSAVVAQEAAIRERYQALVEQEFIRGLTPAEQAEMQELDDQLNDIDASFYEPIIQELERRLAELER